MFFLFRSSETGNLMILMSLTQTDIHLFEFRNRSFAILNLYPMKTVPIVSVPLFLFLSSLSPSSLALEDNSASSVSFHQDHYETIRPLLRDNSYKNNYGNRGGLSSTWLDWDFVSVFADREILSFVVPSTIAGKILRADTIPRRKLQQGELVQEVDSNAFDPDDIIVSVTFGDICKLLDSSL
jgi:hypothetical protein